MEWQSKTESSQESLQSTILGSCSRVQVSVLCCNITVIPEAVCFVHIPKGDLSKAEPFYQLQKTILTRVAQQPQETERDHWNSK